MFKKTALQTTWRQLTRPQTCCKPPAITIYTIILPAAAPPTAAVAVEAAAYIFLAAPASIYFDITPLIKTCEDYTYEPVSSPTKA